MYQEKRPRRGAKRLGAAIAAVCTLLLLLGVWAVWNGAQAAMREQAAQSLRTAVLDAAVQCYALEGAYPQSLSYLEENYGVQVNHTVQAVVGLLHGHPVFHGAKIIADGKGS